MTERYLAQVTCYTDSVANLTLTLEDSLLKKARRIALEKETSVNAMVRSFLTEQVNNELENADRIAEMESFFGASTLGPEGINWKREDLYERS